MKMAKIYELRGSPADTEKITINLGYVDLGPPEILAPYATRAIYRQT
jgi:hypothetical protein